MTEENTQEDRQPEREDTNSPEAAAGKGTSASEWTLERVLAIDGVSEALDSSQIVHASEITSTASGVTLVLKDHAYPGDRDDGMEVAAVKQRLRALLDPLGIKVV